MIAKWIEEGLSERAPVATPLGHTRNYSRAAASIDHRRSVIVHKITNKGSHLTASSVPSQSKSHRNEFDKFVINASLSQAHS